MRLIGTTIFIFTLSIAVVIFGTVVMLILLSIAETELASFSELLKSYDKEVVDLFFDTFTSTATFLGVLVAVATYAHSHWANRRQRAAHNAREFSLYYRQNERFDRLKKLRNKHFPERTKLSYAEWKAAYDGSGEIQEAAFALTEMLNMYETMAIGIEKKELDEDVLRHDLRYIFCSLMVSMREVIDELRRENPRMYEHVENLYRRWRH